MAHEKSTWNAIAKEVETQPAAARVPVLIFPHMFLAGLH